ncbi:MAG: hypothetical protein ACXADW_16730 [Candidatus Hodarchaeales archaeon]|jgi:hypothetical protein
MKYKPESKWQAVERLQRYVDGEEHGHRKSDIVKALALINDLKGDVRRWNRIAHARLAALRTQIRMGK